MAITRVLVFGVLVLILATAATAQTSAFTYQGKLNVAGVPANGQFDMTFALYDTDVATTPVASNIIVENVQVTNGIFSVELSFDFGPFTSVAGNWLEVRIRPGSETGAFTPLTPRQKINSSPYAMQSAYSVFSTFATSATTAANSSAVGGTPAAQIIKEGDGRLTDARVPLPNSPSYIQNRSVGQTPQTADLNINGSGRVNESLIVALDPNSTLAVGTDSPKTKLHVSGDSTVTGNSNVYGVISGDGSGITNLNGANIADSSINASALSADSFPDARNLSQLGSLRWDQLSKKVTYTGQGKALVFDGTFVWVILTDGAIRKFRAIDGGLVGFFSAGTQPGGAAFDGQNIWISDTAGNVVRKMRTYDGVILGTYPVQNAPAGVAFDGTNIWVANTASDSITRIRASDGANLGNLACVGAYELAYDGESMWVSTNPFSSLKRFRASDGVQTGAYGASTGMAGLTVDGRSVWYAQNYTIGCLIRQSSFTPGTETCVATLDAADASDAVWDGTSIWVALNNNTLLRLRTSDNAVIGLYPTAANPAAIVFDGSSVWVAGTNEVRRHPVFPVR
jgi:hypothetical protein